MPWKYRDLPFGNCKATQNGWPTSWSNGTAAVRTAMTSTVKRYSCDSDSVPCSDRASSVSAGNYVFACGPWLPKVFPRLLGPRIFPTRQEVFFFGVPSGDARFGLGALPGWADFNNGDIYYGMPDIEGRGFKVAHDKHGPPVDPGRGDRLASPGALADARAYMAKRFPALAGAPLTWAGFDPVLVYNLLVIAGFILSGFAMAWLVSRWTDDRAAGGTSTFEV